MSKFLGKLEPFMRVLPEVPRPRRPVTFREKVFWTGVVLTIYLVMCEVPLFPLSLSRDVYEPFFFLRMIFASKRGTLAELGIGPIVTAGLIFQLLVGSKIIDVDLTDPKERARFTGGQKMFSLIFIFLESGIYAFSGVYGNLPFWASMAIFLQLTVAGIAILLLDELVQKGWGLGSGVSLFIAAGVAQQIFWLCFSPFTMDDGLPLGAFNALIVTLSSAITNSDWGALSKAFSRPHGLPDIVGLIAMICTFLVIMYLEGVRIELPVIHARYGGLRAKIPLKFLYVSNVPVILAAALMANLYMMANLLSSRFKDAWWLNYLAQYKLEDGRSVLVGGLLYYMSPPRGLMEVARDPMRALIYTVLFAIICVFFAIAWVETSGMDPRSQAEQLVQAGLQIPGFRKSTKIIASVLRRYIPVLSVISGLVVGLIAALADMFGALGSGMGILLLIDILLQYQGIIVQERALEVYPALRRLVGSRRI